MTKTYTPSNRDELYRCVQREIDRLGDACDLNHIDVRRIEDFSGTFASTSFHGNISKWNVLHGKNFARMFETSAFNGDIAQWNVSSAENFTGMFGESAFTKDISNWNVSSVHDFSYMFTGTTFNGDLSNWQTSKATNMCGMFANSSFNRDVSRWDTSTVETMDSMFSNSAFAGDVSQWNVRNVKTVASMFLDAPFDGDLSAWRFHPDVYMMLPNLEAVRPFLDMVSHHEPGKRKTLRLPILPVEGYRLFLSKNTMHSWLSERASRGDIDRYHWDALLFEPKSPWATPEMAQMVQTYLSVVPHMPEPCIQHSNLLMQSWQQKNHPVTMLPLPELDAMSP